MCIRDSINTFGIDAVCCAYVLNDRSEERRLTRVARLMIWIEPIPTAERISRGNLLRIDNQEGFLVREFIHSRSCRKIFRLLHAAMQHQHEWNRLLFAVSG